MLFALVVVVTSACKLSLLNARELWLDETYSAFVAHMPLKDLFLFTAGDVHPPLYYLLLWVWIRVVGDTSALLRLLSVLLDLGSVLLMALLGRRLLSKQCGSLAAILFALSPMLFVYSFEVRSYMLVILLVVALLILHWQFTVERRTSFSLLTAYSLLSALLFYVHYLALFVLAALFFHRVLVSRSAKDRFSRVFTPAIITFVLALPALALSQRQHAAKAGLDHRLELSRKDPRTLSYGGTSQNTAKTLPLHLVKSTATVAGFYPARSPVLLLLCALPLVITFAATAYLWLLRHDEVCRLCGITTIVFFLGEPLLHLDGTRYLLPLIPFFVLALARVIQVWSATRRWHLLGPIAGALLLAIYTAAFYRQATKQHGRPWQNLVLAVQQSYAPQDLVVFDALYSQVPFDYVANLHHFQPNEAGFPISIADWWQSQNMRGWGGPVILKTDLDNVASRIATTTPRTVWLVLYDNNYYDPHNALLSKLRELGQVTEVVLPPDPDAQVADDSSTLHLFRVALRD